MRAAWNISYPLRVPHEPLIALILAQTFLKSALNHEGGTYYWWSVALKWLGSRTRPELLITASCQIRASLGLISKIRCCRFTLLSFDRRRPLRSGSTYLPVCNRPINSSLGNAHDLIPVALRQTMLASPCHGWQRHDGNRDNQANQCVHRPSPTDYLGKVASMYPGGNVAMCATSFTASIRASSKSVLNRTADLKRRSGHSMRSLQFHFVSALREWGRFYPHSCLGRNEPWFGNRPNTLSFGTYRRPSLCKHG